MNHLSDTGSFFHNWKLQSWLRISWRIRRTQSLVRKILLTPYWRSDARILVLNMGHQISSFFFLCAFFLPFPYFSLFSILLYPIPSLLSPLLPLLFPYLPTGPFFLLHPHDALSLPFLFSSFFSIPCSSLFSSLPLFSSISQVHPNTSSLQIDLRTPSLWQRNLKQYTLRKRQN